MKRMLLLGVPAVVLLIAVAVVAWPVSGPHSHVPSALQQTLDAKVATSETQIIRGYGCNQAGATPCADGCTAHTFDMDPPNATTIDQVTAAYAVVFCHETDAGIEGSSRDVVALRFASPPTSVGVPDDGTWADVVKIFPPHAAGAAWWYYTDGAFTLRDRLHRFASL